MYHFSFLNICIWWLVDQNEISEILIHYNVIEIQMSIKGGGGVYEDFVDMVY